MKLTLATFALLGFLGMEYMAYAQTVQAPAKLSWVLPVEGCSVGVTPCDNKPLTGADALTSVQVFVATSPIADASTMAPTLTLTGGATTGTATINATNGATLYARIKACNASRCAGFSAQVSKLVKLDVLPNVATGVTLTIEIAQ